MIKKGILIFLIFLAFFLRLYRVDFPLADWHSWRQADTSAVSRNFVDKGFDLLHPRFDDLSGNASLPNNPEGYRFVEFPIYNAFQAFFYKAYPGLSLEVWGRLISILASLGSLLFLYLITKRFLGERVALLTAFFFVVLPFNIFYSRVILPESTMVFFNLGMIYWLSLWLKESKNYLFLTLGLLFAICSWLIKPFGLVLIFPIAYLAFKKWHLEWRRYLPLGIVLLLSLTPFVLWRWWMSHYPEGIPDGLWLFNDGNIRFKGAWFYWLFAERLGKLILGFWGLILFGLGLTVKPNKKENLFFHVWLGGILAYFLIVAGGNVRHDYYQIPIIPILCVFLAKGADFLINPPKQFFSRFFSWGLLFTSVLFMIAFSWFQVRDYFNINNFAIVEAGKATNRLVPKDAKVIAPYGGDTAFLYQTRRQGWPIGVQIEKFIEQGATYYVNINFDPEVDWLTQVYCVLERTDNHVIINLTKECRE